MDGFSICVPGYDLAEINTALSGLGFSPARLLWPEGGRSRVVYYNRKNHAAAVVEKFEPGVMPHQITLVGDEEEYESVKKVFPLRAEASKEVLLFILNKT